jgi:hypothetical protein
MRYFLSPMAVDEGSRGEWGLYRSLCDANSPGPNVVSGAEMDQCPLKLPRSIEGLTRTGWNDPVPVATPPVQKQFLGRNTESPCNSPGPSQKPGPGKAQVLCETQPNSSEINRIHTRSDEIARNQTRVNSTPHRPSPGETPPVHGTAQRSEDTNL